LIDFVADYRAPTPTGAAEVAVPVLADYLMTVQDYGLRLTRGLTRNLGEKQRLDLARLPKPERLLEPKKQQLTLLSTRMPALGRLLDGPQNRLNKPEPGITLKN